MNLRAAVTAMQSTPPTVRAFAYAGIAFLVGALTQAVQALHSIGAFNDWRAYLISLAVGAVTGGISAALPYLLAMLPQPEP